MKSKEQLIQIGAQEKAEAEKTIESLRKEIRNLNEMVKGLTEKNVRRKGRLKEEEEKVKAQIEQRKELERTIEGLKLRTKTEEEKIEVFRGKLSEIEEREKERKARIALEEERERKKKAESRERKRMRKEKAKEKLQELEAEISAKAEKIFDMNQQNGVLAKQTEGLKEQLRLETQRKTSLEENLSKIQEEGVRQKRKKEEKKERRKQADEKREAERKARNERAKKVKKSLAADLASRTQELAAEKELRVAVQGEKRVLEMAFEKERMETQLRYKADIAALEEKLKRVSENKDRRYQELEEEAARDRKAMNESLGSSKSDMQGILTKLNVAKSEMALLEEENRKAVDRYEKRLAEQTKSFEGQRNKFEEDHRAFVASYEARIHLMESEREKSLHEAQQVIGERESQLAAVQAHSASTMKELKEVKEPEIQRLAALYAETMATLEEEMKRRQELEKTIEDMKLKQKDKIRKIIKIKDRDKRELTSRITREEADTEVLATMITGSVEEIGRAHV